MKTRVLSALAGLCVLLPAIWLGGYVFACLIFLLGIIGLFELARMRKIQYFNMIGLVATWAIGVIIVPEPYRIWTIPGFNTTYLFYVACMVLMILTVYEYKTFNIEDAALLIFGALYIGYGFRYLIMLRDMGLDLIVFQFSVIWATDTGAYLVGRRFGKHKLAPAISPNKTVEGALGGILCAILVSTVYYHFADPHLGGTEHYIILTICLSALGQLGDLVESAFKRHFGVKDSGNLLPGHGGVLDRFDSTLFTSFLLMAWFNMMH